MSMSRVYTLITDRLAEYIREVSLHEPEPLRRLRESTDDRPDAHLQISPEQGQFLQFLARLTGARKALEVGVFMGYSAAWVALGLAPGGKLIACEISREYAAVARDTWQAAGVEDRVELRLGPALGSLDALLAEGQAGSFDMAFIDADKGNYSNYYERALELLRRGGLIAADNVLLHGRVAAPDDREADTEAIRAFNRKLHEDRRVAMTMVTVGDGLSVACKL
jgi:caffeoyl-CoA O-methyltransferase